MPFHLVTLNLKSAKIETKLIFKGRGGGGKGGLVLCSVFSETIVKVFSPELQL